MPVMLEGREGIKHMFGVAPSAPSLVADLDTRDDLSETTEGSGRGRRRRV